jgi:hypothetical protein
MQNIRYLHNLTWGLYYDTFGSNLEVDKKLLIKQLAGLSLMVASVFFNSKRLNLNTSPCFSSAVDVVGRSLS